MRVEQRGYAIEVQEKKRRKSAFCSFYTAIGLGSYRGVTSGLTSEAREVPRLAFLYSLRRDDFGVSRRREKKKRLCRDATS